MNVHVRPGRTDYVGYTNVPGDDATVYHLARKGYGSVAELHRMDTPEFLDLIEFERIQQDIEAYHMQQSERG